MKDTGEVMNKASVCAFFSFCRCISLSPQLCMCDVRPAFLSFSFPIMMLFCVYLSAFLFLSRLHSSVRLPTFCLISRSLYLLVLVPSLYAFLLLLSPQVSLSLSFSLFSPSRPLFLRLSICLSVSVSLSPSRSLSLRSSKMRQLTGRP